MAVEVDLEKGCVKQPNSGKDMIAARFLAATEQPMQTIVRVKSYFGTMIAARKRATDMFLPEFGCFTQPFSKSTSTAMASRDY